MIWRGVQVFDTRAYAASLHLAPTPAGTVALLKPTIRLTSLYDFLTISVQRVVNDPLGGVDLVVVLEAQLREAESNGFQSSGFRLVPERVVRVRSVDDLCQEDECGIHCEIVFLDDRLERTFHAVMAEFDVWNIKRCRAFLRRDGHHLVGWHE